MSAIETTNREEVERFQTLLGAAQKEITKLRETVAHQIRIIENNCKLDGQELMKVRERLVTAERLLREARPYVLGFGPPAQLAEIDAFLAGRGD